MNIIEDLQYRGLINQCSDLKALEKRLAQGPITLYVGFDPTADSLHLGNLLLILDLKRFQDTGHKPIAIAGGGTGLIGDPSGKSEERQLNPEEIVNEWNEKVKNQIERFLDFSGKNKAELVNNYDWLGKLNYLEFLRDIGKHFSLNDMLDKESVKTRLKTGISFTEFNYQVLQAYDFYQLFIKRSCELQLGGSDQWGNIIAGVELIRKKLSQPAFALTLPLVTKSDGTKFGKTAGGAIWLDANKTSPYEFYQFFINVEDELVVQLLKFFTFLSYDEIKALEEEAKKNPEKRQAQITLAQEVTKTVHGEAALVRAERISEYLFSGQIKDLSESELKEAFKGAPKSEIKKMDINTVDLLVETTLSPSKRQARQDLESGAISINGELVKDLEKIIKEEDLLFGKYLVLRRGKKNYHLVSK